MRESCLQPVGAPDSGTAPPGLWDPPPDSGTPPTRLAESVACTETGMRAQGPPRSTEPCRLSWVSSGLAPNQDDEQMPRCARTSGSPKREGRGGGLVGKGGLGRKQKLPRGFQTGQGPQAAASALAGHRNQEIGCGGWGGGVGRRDRDSPRPPQPTVNGHCVWFPAVAFSPARTLAFLH